jgi:cytoskeletal protein CcmA (bactofilin family)
MANTVIGPDLVIDGEISGDESLVIQGKVKGRISLQEKVTVDVAGSVEADIDSRAVEISGRVTGNIDASERVELRGESRVVGDIRAPRILIADGATFKGSVDMDVKER